MTKTYSLDVATGEEGLRDLTEAEQAHFDNMEADFQDKKSAAEKAATDKAALLVKLGITADEAALLLG
jgi:hypothetical protein